MQTQLGNTEKTPRRALLSSAEPQELMLLACNLAALPIDRRFELFAAGATSAALTRAKISHTPLSLVRISAGPTRRVIIGGPLSDEFDYASMEVLTYRSYSPFGQVTTGRVEDNLLKERAALATLDPSCDFDLICYELDDPHELVLRAKGLDTPRQSLAFLCENLDLVGPMLLQRFGVAGKFVLCRTSQAGFAFGHLLESKQDDPHFRLNLFQQTAAQVAQYQAEISGYLAELYKAPVVS